MPRSLRAWLASLALVAFPGLAQAQTFLGPPHLAPVALEARCPLVDGLGGVMSHFMALGADPLHVALLKADEEGGGAAAADAISGQDAVAAEGVADGTSVDAELRESLARLTAAEPVDVSDRNGSERVNRGGERFVGSAAVVVELKEEYLPYDLRADEPLRLRLLPFSVPRCCPLADRPARAPQPEEALATDAAEWPDLAECYAIAGQVARHDRVAADTGAPHCDAEAGQDAIAEKAIVGFADLIPTSRDIEAARRWVGSLRPPMPLHCWLDEAICRVSDVLDAQGPVRRELDAQQLGVRIAQWGMYAERSIADAAEPVMPILARVPAAQNPPAIAPAVLPAPEAAEEVGFSVAAGALHSAAGQLESLAAALRSWGTSVDRVARAKVVVPAAIRR